MLDSHYIVTSNAYNGYVGISYHRRDASINSV
jgi:hypothetical protein